MAKTILIIAGDPDEHDTLKDILGDRFTLALTDDIPSAVDIAKDLSNSIGLIIAGSDVCQNPDPAIFLELNTSYSHIPIITVTGKKSAGNASEISGQGKTESLTRPLRPDHVLKIVEKYMEGK